MPTVMSTEGLPAHERPAYWREVMCRTFVPLEVGAIRAGGDFSGAIRTADLGPLMIAGVASTAQDIARTPRHIATDSAPKFQIALVARGCGRVTQDGRDAELGVGDFVIYETARPFLWAFDADWDALVFTLPRQDVALTEAESRLITAQRFAGDAGPTGLVSRFLQSLAGTEDLGAIRRPDRVVSSMVDLVLGLLGDRTDSEVVRTSVQRSLMTRIKAYVQENLADPELAPARIAAAHHISVRYLHKLFSTEGPTIAEYVRDLRLERCRRDLLDPRQGVRPIADIALHWGFGDISGFNRAFKARVGTTPSDYRNACRPARRSA
jgi:AraC-like DNA-binding protein